jgi:uncharacterized protein
VEPGAEGVSSPPWDAVLYCDSSALVRAYLADEPEHAELSRVVLDADRLVITSALTEVELVAAIWAAARRGRVAGATPRIEEAAADMSPDGSVTLIALDPAPVLSRARALCERHRLRALDAIHLAVALSEREELAGEGELVFVTRDADQAAAARAEGLVVA